MNWLCQTTFQKNDLIPRHLYVPTRPLMFHSSSLALTLNRPLKIQWLVVHCLQNWYLRRSNHVFTQKVDFWSKKVVFYSNLSEVLNSLIWKNEKGKKFGENARKCLQNLLTEINAIFSEYIRDLMYWFICFSNFRAPRLP